MNRRKIKELIKQLQKQICQECYDVFGDQTYRICQGCAVYKIVNEILEELNNGD